MNITFVPVIRFRVVKITMSYSGVAKIECHDIRPNTIVPGKLVCSISTSTALETIRLLKGGPGHWL